MEPVDDQTIRWDDVAGEANREAPAQTGASPYLRRGLLRQPAPS
jgi:hypothetical protein